MKAFIADMRTNYGNAFADSYQNEVLPEPTMLAMLATGSVLLLRRRRR